MDSIAVHERLESLKNTSKACIETLNTVFFTPLLTGTVAECNKTISILKDKQVRKLPAVRGVFFDSIIRYSRWDTYSIVFEYLKLGTNYIIDAMRLVRTSVTKQVIETTCDRVNKIDTKEAAKLASVVLDNWLKRGMPEEIVRYFVSSLHRKKISVEIPFLARTKEEFCFLHTADPRYFVRCSQGKHFHLIEKATLRSGEISRWRKKCQQIAVMVVEHNQTNALWLFEKIQSVLGTEKFFSDELFLAVNTTTPNRELLHYLQTEQGTDYYSATDNKGRNFICRLICHYKKSDFWYMISDLFGYYIDLNFFVTVMHRKRWVSCTLLCYAILKRNPFAVLYMMRRLHGGSMKKMLALDLMMLHKNPHRYHEHDHQACNKLRLEIHAYFMRFAEWYVTMGVRELCCYVTQYFENNKVDLPDEMIHLVLRAALPGGCSFVTSTMLSRQLSLCYESRTSKPMETS